MAVDTPEVQRSIVKRTIVCGVPIAVVTYVLGYRPFVYGLIFGIAIMAFNYRILGVILDKALATAVPGMARVLSFVSYHVRFWIIVIVMYLVIPRQGFQFGIGSFVGLLLPKMMMGVVILKNSNEEWWRKAKPAEKAPLEGVKRDDGIRFPGLDFDERYKEDAFDDTDDRLKL